MFKRTLVVRALSVAFGAVALSVAVGPVAYAQTSATGTVSGQVSSPAGATVVIENVSTGARRTMTPGADGKYQATSMPVGLYKVTLMRNGVAESTRTDVIVTIGGAAEVDFAAAGVERIEVTGRARRVIDVSSVGSTTTLTAAELDKIPVAHNVGAVIQLAPQTTRGDTRYGGGGAPSFGGASSSENAYYINGFPVTTLLTQVGFSQLPFNAIAQAQLLTGGYGAEFGRSTGGVVNIVTKSGGNDVEFGLSMSVEPPSLRGTPKSIYYPDNGPTTVNTNNKLRFFNENNTQETKEFAAYFGAPLIKDKLFLFFATQNTGVNRSEIRQANNGGAGTANSVLPGGWQEVNITKERDLIKLDWNLTDQHHLEYTGVFDQVRDNRRYYSFDYNTLQRGSTQTGGADYVNWGPTAVAAEQGSTLNILKYTGYLSNDLTLTALIGQTNSPHKQTPIGYNPALPTLITADAGRRDVFNYITPQTTTGPLLIPGAYDENQGARVDVEWRVNSQHTLRGGIDYNKIKSSAGTIQDAGGTRWTYGVQDPNVAMVNSVAGNTIVGNPFASVDGLFVRQDTINSQSTPSVIQSAVYVEDRWQVNDRLLLSLGLRNEAFDNRNGDGVSYIKIDKQLAPRFGVVWDANGDSTTKVFGNAGRYHVPLPTNVAIRGAGSSLFVTQNFAYTGVDPVTGAPTGLTAMSPLYSANNEYGQAKDPRQVAAQNMKGNYQDELAFGIEQALSRSWTVGAKLTYRTLKTAIDDHCDDRPFLAWAARNGIDTTNFGGYNCALFNPGIGNTFTLDMNGDGVLETINLSAADLGLPPVNRTYKALDLFAEHPFDGKWQGRISYTYSKNNGNAEGQLLSDIGQGDVATTQNYDFPEFSVNAQGPLPNDRKHQIKAYGYYQALPWMGFGGNLLAASGRPKNCIGGAPSTPALTTPFVPGVSPVTNYSGYGSAYFFCNGVASPRGSQGNLPTDFRVDLNVAIRPETLPGFQARIDLFNAFNRQTVEVIEERYNNGNTSNVFSRYGSVVSYTAPISTRFTLSYDMKF
jgi:hypothetical protein